MEHLFTSRDYNKVNVKFQNNNKLKVGLKLPRVSAILLQIQNGGGAKTVWDFVYIR